ncbi:MAG: hypothetical protein MI802_07915, partial [Desulfobacterales bacterium]|nr:hypothetical protein [Desulfobacterales bacterium]
CAGAFAAVAGAKTLKDIGALGRKMPVTSAAFVMGAFGMCGAPPLAGFISKWHIAAGAVESGTLFFLAVICAGSLLDVVYFFPVIRDLFFAKMRVTEVLGDEEEKVPEYKEKREVLELKNPLTLCMTVPLVMTALFSILFCLFPSLFGIYELAVRAVDELF